LGRCLCSGSRLGSRSFGDTLRPIGPPAWGTKAHSCFSPASAILNPVFRRNTLLVVLGCFLILLTACVPGGGLAPAAATPPNNFYDGQWQAQARTESGTEINLTFVVKDSVLRWFSYSYPGQAGQTCTALIAAEYLPSITNHTFIITVPTSKTLIEGQFDSPNSASGQISFVEVESARALNCVANVNAQWSGTRPAIPAPSAAGPVSASWCGRNVNCPNLLIQLLIFGLVNGAILALNAIGVTVIYGTVRTINLAHGDVFALSTVLVTSTINLLGVNLTWPTGTRLSVLAGILVAAIVLGAVLSVGVEKLAFRPFRGRSRLAPVIASLGLSFILYQASLVWRAYQKSFIRGEHRSVPGLAEVPTDGIPNFLGGGNLLPGKVVLPFSDVFVFLAAILFVIIMTQLLFHTRFGSSIRAVEQNPDLAMVVGVDRDGAIRRAFALGGGLAGAAAFVFALYYSRPFGQAGAESGLTAFAAALLGGIGSPGGALLSGLLLGITGSISDYFLQAQWTPILVLGLLTALLVLRHGGWKGSGEIEQSPVRDSVALKSTGDDPRQYHWLILLFIGIGLLPILTQQFHLGGEILIREAGIFVLLAFGLNILLGLSGVLDLGYAMSYAVGAYTAAILTSSFPTLDFSIVILASIGVAVLFGLLKGSLTASMHGDYLAVATLALGLMTQHVIVNLAVTGGPNGFSNLPVPRLLGISLGSNTAQYYLVLAFVALIAFLSLRLISSRTGRAWLALSDDSTAAASSGIDTGRYRMLAFFLSSAIAGLAGALYANTIRYIDPDIAAFYVSAVLLAMVILGGPGSVSGVILGVALIYAYDRVLIPQLSAFVAMYWPQNTYIGSVPNIRGTNFFNFGIALYLTVLWRAGRDRRSGSRRWRKLITRWGRWVEQHLPQSASRGSARQEGPNQHR
jgi:branched-chain amino acid transport system permease protein